MNNTVRTAIAGALTIATTAVLAYTAEDVERSLHPYKNWTPEHAGYTPGMVINQGNVDQFKDILDPAMYDHIKVGWDELNTMETESFDLHPNFDKTTLAAMASPPTLNSSGTIDNFISGRPFPTEPDANDPQAGLKVAWNYQYGYNWGDNAAICPFYWRYRDAKGGGKLERQLKFCFHFLNWVHRINDPPVPAVPENPAKLFRSIYTIVSEPFDLSNTQLLIHRYQDDTKRDDAWLYLGFQRRVRRLATGQNTDSFLGADLAIEDFEGYNGRISDYSWEFAGTKNVMLPYYRHNELELETDLPPEPDGYQYVSYKGFGLCFPNVKWQLRKAYQLNGRPKDPSHPISLRQMYVDAQTYKIGRTIIYDRNEKIWRSFSIGSAHADHHLPINKGKGLGIDDAFMQLNVQTEHCTTGQFKGIADPAMNPPSMFTVQHLRKAGR